MAFVDATGRVAVHTGALCVEAAGHATCGWGIRPGEHDAWAGCLARDA